jgi:MinD-like ATPase involved in chromosome partitioning or flagellar assembly
VLTTEPIDVFGWPTFLRVPIARHYAELWTKPRICRLIDLCCDTKQPARPGKKLAIEINEIAHKGGAGRTMALANVAALLARWGKKVLVVDWDLEAPGIERFFVPSGGHDREVRSSRRGIVDLIHAQASAKSLDWHECVGTFESGVSVIGAGQDDGGYVERLQGLNFNRLFEERSLGAYIENLRTEWVQEFDFVLVDSRTGVTDIGGICTVHLPDILVVFVTTTNSSVQGALEVIDRSRRAQEKLPLERGRLIVLPVPSRDESRTEYERSLVWKRVFADKFIDAFQDWLPRNVSPAEAIDTLKLPYVPYWSFGEDLPVLKESSRDPSSLSFAYETLARLLSVKLDWKTGIADLRTGGPPTTGTHEIDQSWLSKHRAAAVQGLQVGKKAGYMEAYHICLEDLPDKSHSELLSAARQAEIHTFGWPIGLVMDGRDDLRPRPTNEGLVAKVDAGTIYDYWALTKKGDYYTVSSFFEDERTEGRLFFNTQIIRITELVRHAQKLYAALRADPAAKVELHVRHTGLKGRLLSATQNRVMPFERSNLYEDEVQSSVRFQVGADVSEIVLVVKSICEPLFVIFDFAEFGDPVYTQIVTDFIQGRAT